MSGTVPEELASLMATGRFRALTMPLVTVASRPKGEPTATTSSPTPSASESPIEAGVRPLTPSALMTARSVTGSVPTTVASAVVPSSKLTDSSPPSAATSTTWLLVRISPSSLRITPEPEPEPEDPVTLILTTEGSTTWATPSTESAAAFDPVLSVAPDPSESSEVSGLREEVVVAAGSG